MRAIKHVAGLSILLFVSSMASAASFDCVKAATTTEKLICSDASLSRSDEDLNIAYKHAIEVSPDKTLIRRWQRDWLKSFAVTGCNSASCLKDAFRHRISLLNQVAPLDSETVSWSGRYVRYWKGREDTNSASLFLVGLTGKRVYASGTAIWLGANADNGQVNTGEIEGIGKMQNNIALFDLDECRAKMAAKGNVLVVEDESGCGGLNVTFNGEYRRK